MSKSKKQVIPKLRFIDFKDDEKWNITTFGKLSIPVEDRAGEDSYTLMSVTSGVGLIPQIEKFGREIAGNSYRNYYVIQNGDFAYNKSATKLYPEGYIAMLQGYDNAALPNSIFTCFRIVDKESSPQFFNHLLSSNFHGKWLRKYITVGARANGALSVDNKYLWKMPVAVPKLNEQQKIANCLSTLDDLISDEDKKLISLKEHKKGLMQKLFPADGEYEPEWRFPEFRNCSEWKEKSISEVATYVDYRGKTPEKSAKGVFLVTAKNIKMGYIDYISSKEYIPEENYSDVMSRGLPELGDVLITTEAPCGNVAQIDRTDVALAQRVIKYRGDKKTIINTFLKYILLSPKFQSDLKNKSTGGIVNGIKGSILHKMSIKFPKDLNEQHKIADCLSSVDDLITAQTEKIEALKQHKRALIQGLFPSSQEVFE